MGHSATVDLLSGTVAGVGQLVVGHPFDTVKVKLQSQPGKYTGAVDCVKKILETHGPRGLFKGMSAPLSAVALYNAVLFAARGEMERLLAHPDGSPLSLTDHALCGAGAGVGASVVACPTELLKCRLQAQSGRIQTAAAPAAAAAAVLPSFAAAMSGTTTAAAPIMQASAGAGGAPAPAPVRYRGPVDVYRHILQEAGPAGLVKGAVPTLLREIPGSAALFLCYEWTKARMVQHQGLAGPQELGRGSLLTAGGMAGAAYWLSVYPADVIKSKIQTDSFSQPRYSGTIDCARKIFAFEGIPGFFRGFSPALARSLPANGAAFLLFEMTRDALSK